MPFVFRGICDRPQGLQFGETLAPQASRSAALCFDVSLVPLTRETAADGRLRSQQPSKRAVRRGVALTVERERCS